MVDYPDIKKTKPNPYFYNLFACGATNYSNPNYIGGWYLFSESNVMGVIGSAKVGGMLEYGDFYRPLRDGDNLGQAFLKWFQIHGPSRPEWFYGMNILGDPTLIPTGMDLSNEDSSESNQSDSIPGFEIPIVLCALCITVIIRKKREKII